MHLRAMKPVTVTSRYLPQPITLHEGETIHTKNSHKYRVRHIERLAEHSGLSIDWMAFDTNQWFSVTTLVKESG